MRGKIRRILLLAALLIYGMCAYGGKIDQYVDIRWWEQAKRFWSADPAILHAMLGTLFIGINCGLLGSFVVVRRMALIGDTLAHAVLPGVALGFLWAQRKDPLAIFVGATIAAVAGIVIINLIQKTTHIKKDSTLAMVLSGFYALGIGIITLMRNSQSSNAAGIDQYLFGQAAAISKCDLWLTGLCSALSIVMVVVFYKELLVISFDRIFAWTTGIPTQLCHYGFMLILTFTIVISLQTAGIILVTAMLITPAASAYLLTERLHTMLMIAMLFGVVSGMLGIFLSFLGSNFPTGPFIVLCASAFFLVALIISPRHGILPRWLRQRRQSKRILIENTLKAIYHILEANNFYNKSILTESLARYCNTSLHEAEKELTALQQIGYIDCALQSKAGSHISKPHNQLTPSGWQKACEVVRNHRLWELYLTRSANYPADHVHEDAEHIEHILGKSTVHALEQSLNYPQYDPHGKKIPSLADLEKRSQPCTKPKVVTTTSDSSSLSINP